MFNDVEALVTAQEPLVEETEHNAIQTQTDVENANTHVDKAIGFARNRNKLKWWCLLIVILIILGIALGIGLGVGLNRAVSTGNNSRQLDGIDNRGGEGNNGGRPGDSVNDGFGPNGSNDGLARVGGRNGTSDGKPRL